MRDSSVLGVTILVTTMLPVPFLGVVIFLGAIIAMRDYRK